MKVLFLVPYPAGESPSQRFRFEQYTDILDKHGVMTESQSFWSLQAWRKLYSSGHIITKVWGLIGGFLRRWFILFKAGKFDFIFIHREMAPIGPPIFEWIIARLLRKKIIFDFDDAIWLPNTSRENSLVAFLKWHSKTSSICKWSYTVSCGNAHLAEYATSFNKNVRINPTTIDTLNLHNPSLYRVSKNPATTLGWTGTHSTLKYLDFLAPTIRELEMKFALKFVVIANKKPSLQISCLEFVEWSRETEISDLMKFDVGLMPLTDDVWAKGKCGFKALQYMSLGIPTVASPVGVNTAIIENEVNGFLCDTAEQWKATLTRLIENAELRNTIGRAGMEKVKQQYSVESNKENFLALFREG